MTVMSQQDLTTTTATMGHTAATVVVVVVVVVVAAAAAAVVVVAGMMPAALVVLGEAAAMRTDEKLGREMTDDRWRGLAQGMTVITGDPCHHRGQGTDQGTGEAGQGWWWCASKDYFSGSGSRSGVGVGDGRSSNTQSVHFQVL